MEKLVAFFVRNKIWTNVLMFSVFGFGLMLLAYNYPTVLLTVSLFVLSNAMLRPAISSLTSQEATIGQGVAMGLNNSFMSLGRIFGPLTAGFLFDIKIHYPYSIGAFVMLIGFVVSLIWLRKKPDTGLQLAD